MKRLLAIILSLAAFLTPSFAYATYNITHVANLVRASNEYFVASENTNTAPTGDETIETWVNFSSTSNLMFIYDHANASGATTARWYFSANSLNFTFAHLCNGSDGLNASVAWTPSTNTWYHLAVTYTSSSGAVKFYVNGVQQGATGTVSTGGGCATVGSSPKILGEDNGGVRSMDGDGSLFRVWTVVRTATDLTNNKCSVLGATSNLGAEWTLDNTLADNSGNSNTLTNSATPATFVTSPAPPCPASSSPYFGTFIMLTYANSTRQARVVRGNKSRGTRRETARNPRWGGYS